MKTTNDLMTLALRVVAVVIGAYAFVALANLANFLLFSQWSVTVLWAFVATMWSTPLIVALALWWLSPVLARLATRGLIAEIDCSGLSIGKLMHAAFIVMGVWIFLFSIAALVKYGLQISWHGNRAYIPSTAWAYLVAYGVRCVFGVGLVIGGGNLARFLLYLRTAGSAEGRAP